MTIRVDGAYKLGFVHLPKNGGTSVVAWLYRVLREKNQNNKSHIKRYPFHATLASIHMPSDYNSCGIVRNPWDRMVSIYEFDKYCRYGEGADKKYPILFNADPQMEFKDWIKHIHTYRWQYEIDTNFIETKLWFTPITPQTIWLPWEPNILIRFDRMNEGFNALHEIMRTDLPIGHEHNTRHGPYQEYYDDNAIKIVEKLFATDIERWGFKFD